MRVIVLALLASAHALSPWQLSRVARLRGGSDPYDPPDGAGWEGDFDFGGNSHPFPGQGVDDGAQQSAQGAFGDPRQDGDDSGVALGSFMAAFHGKVLLRLGAAIEGVLLGELLKNMLGRESGFGLRLGVATLFVALTFAGGDVGEFSRRLGLALAFTAQRYWVSRGKFPVMPHVFALLRVKPRVPFPGNQRGEYNQNVSFASSLRRSRNQQVQALLLLVLLGGFLAGKISIPLCPKWIRSLGGSVAIGMAATGEGPLGDLTRTIGAKTLLMLGTFLSVLGQLGVGGLFWKNLNSSAQFVRKVDEQFGIGKKVGGVVNKGVNAAAEMMQGDPERDREPEYPDPYDREYEGRRPPPRRRPEYDDDLRPPRPRFEDPYPYDRRYY